MDVRCPECETSFTAQAPGPVTCPACMSAFTAGEDPSLWAEPELRRADGELLGRMDRYLVRQKLYAGQLNGLEQVRAPGGEWMPLASRPEFAEILDVLGVDLGARRISQQQLKGWRKTGSAVRSARPSAELRAELRAEKAKPAEQARSKPPVWLVPAILAAGLALGLAWWLI